MTTPAGVADMASDVRLALALAEGRPTGPATDVLRGRLRTYIGALLDPADAYAANLADSRARDIAVNTVRHARAVVQDPVQDPAANLRLLAKAVDHLARYAAASQEGGRR
ncbi:DUF6415 family natural product biosynthesis protein [Streptomyces sp. SPB162]|uniref:DUF6415 family natural product biosynthesis protein n=1 Tax=Streptomyces sp. SPB162 TaxID=2940560 RepID=UPI002406B5A4|nr:DUF6415 family natural product biosynthesis protein [Streptomyces sp. SPB162]MDF9814190.1 hypothetical protein [Streptomyces sp. SPB162]